MLATVPISELPLARLTTAKYHALIRSGAFTEEDRLELIDGYLVQKRSVNSLHAGVVKALNFLLSRRLGDRVIVSIQDPISINEYSEPEPDVVIAKFREDFYKNAHPEPADVLLVIEVADTSLTYDRTAKIPLYAAAGIAESWLVDLTARHITVFSQPGGAAYLKAQTFQAADTLSAPGYPDVSLTVDELGL